MVSVLVRNLPEETHRAIKARAAEHGQSTEAEIREILSRAVKPDTRLRLGDALAALGREAGLTDQDFEIFEHVRDKTPAAPLNFE
jgi:plasmid stability protein